MNILPIPLEAFDTFELVGGVVVLLTFFVAVFWLNIFLFGKLIKKLKKEETLVHQESYQEALKILDAAKNQSFSILNSANSKAQNILSAANELNDKSKTSLQTEIESLKNKQLSDLNKATQELLNTYRGVLSSEKEGSIRTLKDVSEDLKEEVVAEFEEFSETLEKSTFNSEKLLEDQTKKEYEEIRQKMKNYETSKLQKIDENILKIVARATKQIVGEALSMEKHSDLVIKSLEEAKEEAIFGGQN